LYGLSMRFTAFKGKPTNQYCAVGHSQYLQRKQLQDIRRGKISMYVALQKAITCPVEPWIQWGTYEAIHAILQEA